MDLNSIIQIDLIYFYIIDYYIKLNKFLLKKIIYKINLIDYFKKKN